MTDHAISVVIASAGAGKTSRVVNDIADEVERRDPEEIVATTFTIKAADELIERSRAKLFETGRPDRDVSLAAIASGHSTATGDHLREAGRGLILPDLAQGVKPTAVQVGFISCTSASLRLIGIFLARTTLPRASESSPSQDAAKDKIFDG